MSGRVLADRALSASPTAPVVAALSGNDPSRRPADDWLSPGFEEARASLPVAPKPKFKSSPPYIVWSPDGPTPPVVAHRTHGAAFAVAHKMAALHPGQTFHVMQCASRAIIATSEEPVDA